MAKVTFDNVSKEFKKGTFAVKDFSLQIEHGEFVSVVGPSGCGKSTTLNLIAGLELPTSGRVLIGDKDVTREDPGARDVAMVFQSYALYPHLDVAQNIAFPLKVAKLSKAEIEARVRETAARLGLEQLLTRKPRELSGGQRQRVALGRALVRRPKVFLFDEPLSNLDAGLRAQMRGELKKLHEALKTTFVYVTHDQAEAMTLSDRVVLMRAGQMEQVGSPRELYDRPRHTFAATFFGSPAINLVPPETFGASAPGMLLGVRPEHVEVGFGDAPANAQAKGRVYLVEPSGAESWVTVEVGTARVTARTSEQQVRTGDAAWLRSDPSRWHWFDAASGERKARS